jgi:hypothetical protein
MNEGPVNQGALIETTDCLEAVGVFRGWKNLFFLIAVIGLLLVQAGFWLVDRGIIPAGGGSQAPVAVAMPADASAVASTAPVDANAVASPAPVDANAVAGTAPVDANAVTTTVAEVPVDTNQPSGPVAGAAKLPVRFLGKLDAGHLARALELINGILIVTVVLYVLAMFFNLMVSLVGRLGGIRHISRAFFLSVIVLVLIIPWQIVVSSRVPGVLYTLPELLNWMAGKNESTANMVLYYLRFSGYWLVFFLLLLTCQLRSARWTKSILRRLEII